MTLGTRMSSSEFPDTSTADGSSTAANNPSILISTDGCLAPDLVAAAGGKDVTGQENFYAGRRSSYAPVSPMELQPTLPGKSNSNIFLLWLQISPLCNVWRLGFSTSLEFHGPA